MPAGSGAVMDAPSGVCQRSQRKFTTCGRITRSCTTKFVYPLKRDPCGGVATLTVRSSWIDSFDVLLPFRRVSPPAVRGVFGSVALSIPLGLIFPRPAFEAGDLVALRCNRSPQLGHFFKQLQHQALQITQRKIIKVCRRHHSNKESDSCIPGNLIIIPPPRLLPLLRNFGDRS